MRTFVEDVATGRALLAEVEDYMDRWHGGAGENISLRDFLGLTPEQYVAFMRDPATLKEAVPKLTVPDVLPRVHAYRDLPGNGVGGSLHIVLADGNVRDCDVRYCLEHAITKSDHEGAVLARLLLGMTKTQRKKVGAQFYG